MLDRSKAESDSMLGKTIAVRCRGFGWCIGKIIKKVTRGLSNFVAKLDVDSEVALLSLESKDYDFAPDGAYEAWMILEPTPTDEGAAEAGEADGAGEAVQ